MRLLILCDEGNNRSVTLAHQLKYLGHDILAAGLRTNGSGTLQMLCDWAERIILTDRGQDVQGFLPGNKVLVWQIGPDVYPRPFNKDLLRKVRQLIEAHRGELVN